MINSDVLYYAEEVQKCVQELEVLVEGHALAEDVAEHVSAAVGPALAITTTYIDGNDRERIMIARQHLLSAHALLLVACGVKA